MGNSLKKRIAFKKIWLENFLNNGEIDVDELLELNRDKKKSSVLDFLNKLNEYLFERKYTPVLETSYQRKSYRLKGNKHVRLTIDQNLRFKKLADFNIALIKPYQRKMLQSGSQLITSLI